MENSTTQTMKERLQQAAVEGSEMPTVTYVTSKAICFCIFALITIVCMFQSWCSFDIDLIVGNLKDYMDKVNLFTLPGQLDDLKSSLGAAGSLLFEDLMDSISVVHIISIIFMLTGICSIGCLVISVILRLSAKEECVKIGRIGALLAMVASVGFAVLITSVVANFLKVIEVPNATMYALRMVATAPLIITLVSSVIVAVCAAMNMEFKEDVVIYHDGKMVIAKGPKWKCQCGKKNLSPLDRCCYCGKSRE